MAQDQSKIVRLRPGIIVNIVDNRSFNYLWKSLDVCCEPAWHDNSIKPTDLAEPLADHEDWSYDEALDMSLAQALVWAANHPGEVTLYLYDLGALSIRYRLNKATGKMERLTK